MEKTDVQFTTYKPEKKATAEEKKGIIDFLFKQLEQYGDPREDISKCFDYAMQHTDSPGGFCIKMELDNQIVGVVIINKTGMKGYIPENILVYIATHADIRGKGLGKQLMKEAIAEAEGAIALHVEPDNPAKYLYEKLGFTNKYLEMRLSADIVNS